MCRPSDPGYCFATVWEARGRRKTLEKGRTRVHIVRPWSLTPRICVNVMATPSRRRALGLGDIATWALRSEWTVACPALVQRKKASVVQSERASRGRRLGEFSALLRM